MQRNGIERKGIERKEKENHKKILYGFVNFMHRRIP